MRIHDAAMKALVDGTVQKALRRASNVPELVMRQRMGSRMGDAKPLNGVFGDGAFTERGFRLDVTPMS